MIKKSEGGQYVTLALMLWFNGTEDGVITSCHLNGGEAQVILCRPTYQESTDV
jgi:hypothetical protein